MRGGLKLNKVVYGLHVAPGYRSNILSWWHTSTSSPPLEASSVKCSDSIGLHNMHRSNTEDLSREHKKAGQSSVAALENEPRSQDAAETVEGTRISATLAPRIRSFCDAEIKDTNQYFKCIVQSAEGVFSILESNRLIPTNTIDIHTMYNKCRIVNGDISMKSLCWIPGNKKPVSVITDFDDKDEEELARLEEVSRNRFHSVKKILTRYSGNEERSSKQAREKRKGSYLTDG